MKRLFLAIIPTLYMLIACQSKEQQISVMQFNIWQEGTVIEGGYEAIVEELAHHKPDFVTLSEVRNYNDIDFTAKLIKDLEQKGLTYYSSRSDDSGLLSRYPIDGFKTIFPLKDDSGSIYKLTTSIQGVKFAIYTAHLDYKNEAYLLPRGYDGVTFTKMDAPITDLKEIEKMNLASKRDDAIIAFIEDAKQERQEGAVVILGGDFNEPSHRDWIEQTKNMYDHNGVVINWNVTTMLEDAGFVDSYREIYPSPITHPGFTYPSDNKMISDENINKLTWSGEADERERIDMIFYTPHPNIELTNSVIYGPSDSIIRSKRVEESSKDTFITPQGIWPTDHKGVISYFKLSY